MRRVSQLESISLSIRSPFRHTRRPQFICATCRATIAPSSPSPFANIHTSAIKAAPGGIPLLERVRRRVKGGSSSGSSNSSSGEGSEAVTETPLSTEEAAQAQAESESTATADGPGANDPRSKRVKKKAARKASGRKKDPTYEPAKTWDGLEEVGEIVDPREYTRVPGQIYNGFMPLEQAADPTELTQALRDSFEFTSSNGAPDREGVAATESGEDSAWLSTSFESDNHKFNVLKRFMQLTGVRVSDQIIESSQTAQGLLNHIIAPPKPKKLVETLLADDALQELPNVQIYERRVTPIDKETKLGRWKLIEKELESRGLPVTGHTS